MSTHRTAIDSDEPRKNHLDALRVVARERRDLDRREHYHVMSARAAGYSWHAIAAMLGVSRQAAHRRFRKQPQSP